MTTHRTPEEIRRFDLMKLGVTLLLLVLLVLTWIATREIDGPDLAAVATDDAVNAATADAAAQATRAAELSALPAPTLVLPAVDTPADPLPPGRVTLSGVAGPGAQVAVFVNGGLVGTASAGVDGAWSLATDLPAGSYTITAQTLDNVGAVVGESAPVTVTVGETAAPTAAGEIAPGAALPLRPPIFNPLTGAYTLGGVVTPGATVVVIVNGAPIGATTADDAGNWALDAPAESVTGEIVVQATDAAGSVIEDTEPAPVGPPPASLNPPGPVMLDPATGAATLAVPSGPVTWTGQGQPGVTVEAVVDGQPAGSALVDETGGWTLALTLPDGAHQLQLNTLDASGALLSSTPPVALVVGTAPVATTLAEAAPTEGAPTEAALTDNVMALLQSRPEFSTLLSAIGTAGLIETLSGPNAVTLFAPTNDAIAALPPSIVERLLANPTALAGVLRYHIAPGRYLASDLGTVAPATLNGRLLTITPQGDSLFVNDATVLAADIPAGNSMVHAIDRVLVPPLAEGVRPPVIDESGVPTFSGTQLTVVGTAEPNRTILVELNGESFGATAAVDANGVWQVTGAVSPGEYRIIAYMLDSQGALEAISRPVSLAVQ